MKYKGSRIETKVTIEVTNGETSIVLNKINISAIKPLDNGKLRLLKVNSKNKTIQIGIIITKPR